MTRQFNRSFTVQAGTVRFSELDVRFKVVKTLKPEPNTCELLIWNLNEQHRRGLELEVEPVVEILAGYEDDQSLIFRGAVREVFSRRDAAAWITELRSGDGEKAVKKARINKSFAPGSKLPDVLNELAKEIKVDIGNALTSLQGATLGTAGGEYVNGTTVTGKASRQLTKILKSAGKEWSIQDGALQLLDVGQFLRGFAVVVSPETGMIGSPTIGNDGILRTRMLLDGDLVPGRQVKLQTRDVPPAFFRVERAEYIGDTAGQDWYVDIEAATI